MASDGRLVWNNVSGPSASAQLDAIGKMTNPILDATQGWTNARKIFDPFIQSQNLNLQEEAARLIATGNDPGEVRRNLLSRVSATTTGPGFNRDQFDAQLKSANADVNTALTDVLNDSIIHIGGGKFARFGDTEESLRNRALMDKSLLPYQMLMRDMISQGKAAPHVVRRFLRANTSTPDILAGDEAAYYNGGAPASTGSPASQILAQQVQNAPAQPAAKPAAFEYAPGNYPTLAASDGGITLASNGGFGLANGTAGSNNRREAGSNAFAINTREADNLPSIGPKQLHGQNAYRLFKNLGISDEDAKRLALTPGVTSSEILGALNNAGVTADMITAASDAILQDNTKALLKDVPGLEKFMRENPVAAEAIIGYSQATGNINPIKRLFANKPNMTGDDVFKLLHDAYANPEVFYKTLFAKDPELARKSSANNLRHNTSQWALHNAWAKSKATPAPSSADQAKAAENLVTSAQAAASTPTDKRTDEEIISSGNLKGVPPDRLQKIFEIAKANANPVSLTRGVPKERLSLIPGSVDVVPPEGEPTKKLSNPYLSDFGITWDDLFNFRSKGYSQKEAEEHKKTLQANRKRYDESIAFLEKYRELVNQASAGIGGFAKSTSAPAQPAQPATTPAAAAPTTTPATPIATTTTAATPPVNTAASAASILSRENQANSGNTNVSDSRKLLEGVRKDFSKVKSRDDAQILSETIKTGVNSSIENIKNAWSRKIKDAAAAVEVPSEQLMSFINSLSDKDPKKAVQTLKERQEDQVKMQFEKIPGSAVDFNSAKRQAKNIIKKNLKDSVGNIHPDILDMLATQCIATRGWGWWKTVSPKEWFSGNHAEQLSNAFKADGEAIKSLKALNVLMRDFPEMHTRLANIQANITTSLSNFEAYSKDVYRPSEGGISKFLVSHAARGEASKERMKFSRDAILTNLEQLARIGNYSINSDGFNRK